MAHYALLDENNIVINVIPGHDECDEIDWEKEYTKITGFRCKRTSYNTSAGIHLHGKTPFRYTYASIGYLYIDEIDCFIPNKPYPSWILDLENKMWVPPIPTPTQDAIYTWDEETQSWWLI